MFLKSGLLKKRDTSKENALFFSSMLISIVALYILLSLTRQDVMIFLAKMESNAVHRLLAMVPVLYGFTLCILFFQIYYASKMELERRKHEMGIALMLGMRRDRLFRLLLWEDVRGSLVSLLIGLPVGVLLSEIISLVTARSVGLGIVGHRIFFSLPAAIGAAIGFFVIKLVAFLLLSGFFVRREIGDLLLPTPVSAKKHLPKPIYAAFLLCGVALLIHAYHAAIQGESWLDVKNMAFTVTIGLIGTAFLFHGLRYLMDLLVRFHEKKKLGVYNIRQIQEMVIFRTGSMAICSLLMLSALVCFGTGVAVAHSSVQEEQRALDYTFPTDSTDIEEIRNTLKKHRLDARFSQLFELKVGRSRTDASTGEPFQSESLITALEKNDPQQENALLIDGIRHDEFPYLIALSGYNELMKAAGRPTLSVGDNEMALYVGKDWIGNENRLNETLATRPEIDMEGTTFNLTGYVQSIALVTNRSLSLGYGFIVSDATFDRFTNGEAEKYLNGVLAPSETARTSLLRAISAMNEELNSVGLSYESYLENIGRQLFFMVATSYLTIYLAVLFLVIANTVLGVQFLLHQQESSHRIGTLIHLGADYTTLCRSNKTQIRWYFGLPILVALISSHFGVRGLMTGLLPRHLQGDIGRLLAVSAWTIVALTLVESMYILFVRKASNRVILTRMQPTRVQ